MKHCAESYSILGLSQWSSEPVIAILQKRKAELQDLSDPCSCIPHVSCYTTLITSLYPRWGGMNRDGGMKTVFKQTHVFAGLGAHAAREVPSVRGYKAAHRTPAVSGLSPSWGLLISQGDPYRARCALGLESSFVLRFQCFRGKQRREEKET